MREIQARKYLELPDNVRFGIVLKGYRSPSTQKAKEGTRVASKSLTLPSAQEVISWITNINKSRK